MRHWLEPLLNPLMAVIALLLVVMWKAWREDLRLKWWLALALALLLAASLPTLPRYCTAQIEAAYPPVRRVDEHIRWVVVLSGGQADYSNYPAHDRLYGASLKRLLAGVYLYRRLPQAKLILSGGGGALSSEAHHLEQVSRLLNLPSEDLVLEASSNNTQEQAQKISRLIPKGQAFYLVTSAIHMPRARYLFEQAGLVPIPAATDYTLYWQDDRAAKRWLPAPQNLVYVSILLHEWVGFLYARVT